MKLYKVRAVYETVIRAESQREAEINAPYILRNEADEEPDSVSAQEIKSLDELPNGWNARCRAWGERDPHDREIGEILDSEQHKPQG